MASFHYIPLSYFSYHRPYYVGSWLILILFSVFIAMMYLALDYEVSKVNDVCKPQYYYGKPCYNEISKHLLLNPEFVSKKDQFYTELDKFVPETQSFKGAKQTVQNAKTLVEDVSEPAIKRRMKENEEFIQNNEEQISTMTSLLQLLSLKYLGNVQKTIQVTDTLPAVVQEQLISIPNELDNLRILVKNSLVDPVYAKYTAPLTKLYQSLMEIKEPPLMTPSLAPGSSPGLR